MNRKTYLKYLEKSGIERLRFRIEVDKGRVVDLMVQYETLIDGIWHTIVRYDMAHGFFHRDTLYPDGEKVKTAIEISDLNVALQYAAQDLKDKWEFYKERYTKQL